MRRSAAIAYVWLVLIIALLGGFAWLTRHPEAEIVLVAEEWPVVGTLARSFRRAYLPPVRPRESGTRPESPAPAPFEDDAVPTVDELYGARPYVWVEPGTPLYPEPDFDSPSVEIVDSIRNLAVVSRKDDWFEVQVSVAERDRDLFWVYLEGYVEPTAERLARPDPVVPMAAVEIDEQVLDRARSRMVGGGREAECGAYRVITDLSEHPVLDRCSRLSEQVELAFLQRYGLEAKGPPAETILVFSSQADYVRFREESDVFIESNVAHAMAAKGYLAFYSGDRSPADLLQTLTHELAHLVSRRTLGPALPPWLGEGIADDLAQSKIDRDGTLFPGQLGGETRVAGRAVTRTGGLAAVIELQNALDRGDLPYFQELVRMPPGSFRESDRAQLHYAASSAWVRYLLSGFDPSLAPRFRSFLAEVAAGRPLTEGLLLSQLELEWQELEGGFRAWLRLQFLSPLDEIREEAS